MAMCSDTLPYTILRPFNYTGPGQAVNFVVPKSSTIFGRGQSVIELGNTRVVREYGDVRRVVASYLQLCQLRGNGEVYNIATGSGVTLNEVVDHCARIVTGNFTARRRGRPS